MKRIVVPLLVILVAAIAFWFRGHWLPAPPGQLNYLGYVEGETVLISAPYAGRIVKRPAEKGNVLNAGDVVFGLDTEAAEAEVADAEAAIKTAEAVLANLETGKRDVELAFIRAQKQEAQANLDMARKELSRASALATTGTAAQQRLDEAEMQVQVYEARVSQLEATEAVALLPARPYELEAAASRIAEAKAAAAVARRKLLDLTPLAPVTAMVDDTFFDVGEWVGAGQPVVSLLPDTAVTLRFFVPEADLVKAKPGTKVNFSCDSCAGELTATITNVAAEPEYTPPVIYSQGARSKLVFRVEARPDGNAGLRPGLPIEVEPLQ